MAENFERTFVFDRSTKNKHVFQEIVPTGAAEAIGSLYVSKKMCTDGQRRNLQVRVEFLTNEEMADAVDLEASAG